MSANTASPANTLALLNRLKTEMPELWDKAQVVGKWVWLEFNVPPLVTIRTKLKDLGFHWNGKRKCWQHPCGARSGPARDDPRGKYQVTPASAVSLEERRLAAHEYKVISLRECPLPTSLAECDTPDKVADYWRLHIATHPYFNPECECFVVLLLNTRRRIKGHQLVSIGTMDTILIHPREVFRIAVTISASAIVLAHNHPSGESSPSDADIKVTRDLIRAGQLLKIEVLDHVIMGHENRTSLREQGYFAA